VKVILFKTNRILIIAVTVISVIAIISSSFLYLQTTNLQTQVTNLQSEATTLNSTNNALESQVSNLQAKIASLENDKVNLNSQVTILQANVSSFQSETTTLNNKKIALEKQITNLQSEATTLENEKNTLETQVTVLQTNISGLQSEVVSLENLTLSLETKVSNLQSEVTSLENEVIQSYDNGYIQGVEDGAGRGWNIRDPTYNEAIYFINSDKTDENEYTDDYVCWNFVADFKNNAFNAGYRAGDVYVEFVDSAHGITCFNTTDKGLIFIEPQGDRIVTLTIGEPYWDRNIYEIPDYDDTIVKYAIIW